MSYIQHRVALWGVPYVLPGAVPLRDCWVCPMCYLEWHNCGTVGCVLCATWSGTITGLLDVSYVLHGMAHGTAGCVLYATRSGTNAGLLGMVRYISVHGGQCSYQNFAWKGKKLK